MRTEDKVSTGGCNGKTEWVRSYAANHSGLSGAKILGDFEVGKC